MPGAGVLPTALELLDGLRAGRLSSEALVAAAIVRTRAVNPSLNAVIALDEEGAIARARAADRAAAAGQDLGALHGLPITVKDCFEVAGFAAVNGAVEFRDYRPARNATVVQRAIDAGAIVIGKTNVPAYSLDLQTFNDVFGVTRNPWNPECTPGGSSGGAAVALATGITSLEIGNDLAGSLRNPAHCTGVCALKPSYGIVPTAGAVGTQPGRLRTPDLVVAGPMARSVADLGLLLGVLAGPGARDAAGWRLELPPARGPGAALRIAAWLDDETCPVEPRVGRVIGEVLRSLRAGGISVDENARPGFDPAEYFRMYLELLYGEMSAGFPEHMFRAFASAARRPPGAGAWTPLSVMPAAVVQTHRDWLRVAEQRERCRGAWDEFFSRYDLLLTPVAPDTARPHDQRPFEERTITLRGRTYPFMQQSFWCALATTCYLPAAAVPAGIAEDGLPLGLQIIGPYLGDRTVLEFAAEVEKTLGRLPRPPFTP